VNFPLNIFGQTYWSDKNSPGFWLAIDEDESGAIDKREELFGQFGEFVNGFESLKKYDSNKDGWIDARDAKFSKLLLWNDRNGDGKSQKSELIQLSKKIRSISLAYQDGHLRPIGRYAEEREKSFAITVKGKKVEVIDIWLAPKLPETKLQQAQAK
jgi:hypothetical protein